MNAISIELLCTFLLLIVRNSFSADLVSRCPKILRYEEQIEEDRWQGVLELKSRQGSEGVWLNIALDSKADALINTFGASTTLNNQNFQINNPEYVLLPGAPLRVKFTVKYDKNQPTPYVVSVKLNGVEVCDESSIGSAITEATNDLPTRKDAPTQRPFTPSTRKTVFRINECGLKPQARPLLYNSKKAEGYWPWHIAIMKLTNIQYDYHCGGTLISAKSVLTAAHCVTVLTTTKLRDKDKLILYLGITNLSDQGPYFKVRLVQDMLVHNEYNPSRYHNDIAIITVEPVEFNDFLRPICLWEGDLQITGLIGQFGTIVGWGVDNTNASHTADLMEGKMPVVALETCLYHDPNFFALFTSPKTFCAGGPNGTAVCSGDSGGGMVFPRKGPLGNEVWYIRGVVSVSPRDSESVCNTKTYYVFTDVARHLDWIRKTAGI